MATRGTPKNVLIAPGAYKDLESEENYVPNYLDLRNGYMTDQGAYHKRSGFLENNDLGVDEPIDLLIPEGDFGYAVSESGNMYKLNGKGAFASLISGPKPLPGDVADYSHSLMQGILLLTPFVNGSGSTVTDFSGNNNQGAIVAGGGNGVGHSWLTAEGGALHFNGGSLGDYVDFGNISSSLFSGDFTIIFRVNMPVSNTMRVVDKMHDTNPSLGTSFRAVGNSTNTAPVNMSGGPSGTLIGFTDSLRNEWQRYLFTRVGSDLSFYTNGILVETTNTPPVDVSSTYSFFIGHNSNGADRFKGEISDLRAYERGFSPSDVALDFSAPWSMF